MILVRMMGEVFCCEVKEREERVMRREEGRGSRDEFIMTDSHFKRYYIQIGCFGTSHPSTISDRKVFAWTQNRVRMISLQI